MNKKQTPTPDSNPTIAHPLTAAPTPPMADIDEPPTSSGDTAADARTLDTIRSHLPPLTPLEIQAYTSQISDADCEKLGTKTRAEKVRNEASGWIVLVDKQLRSPEAADIAYSARRLRFFLYQYDQLNAALLAQDAAQGQAAGAERQQSEASRTAENVDERLSTALSATAGKRPTESSELAEVPAAGSTPEEQVKRLRAQASLGASWLERSKTDPALAILAEDARLTPALLAEAAHAADALGDARTGRRSSRRIPNDPPEVNRVEGRLLYEMKFAMQQNHAAHARNRAVRSIVPTAATRIALVGRVKSASRNDSDQTPASPPSLPATP